MLRDTLPVGGRCLLVGGVASQTERPQARSLFPRRAQFGLVLGHCLLALTQLPFFLEQSFGATMRLIRIRAQSRTPLVRPNTRPPLDPKALSLECSGRRGSMRKDYVGLQVEQLFRGLPHPVNVAGGPTNVHPQVTAIGPTQLRKSLREPGEVGFCLRIVQWPHWLD